MVRIPLLFRITDLVLAILGFGVAAYVWVIMFPDLPVSLDRSNLVLNSALFCFTFWIVIQVIASRESGKGWMSLFVEQATISLGVSFILLALLTYFSAGDYNPLLISAGALFSTALLVTAELLVYDRFIRKDTGVLLLGADEATEALAGTLREPMIGVLDAEEQKGSRLPYLGGLQAVDAVVSRTKPRYLVVSSRKLAGESVPAHVLIRHRLKGAVVQDSVQLCEALARRISHERLDPADILLYPSLRASRAAMAVQAIYTNLIGLALLMLFTPVLALAGLASLLLSDRGPVFEKMECLGFQMTPFFLLRFRTRKMDGSGQLTMIGSFLTKLRIVNLPHLINIVRGELALCGPRPVRVDFAHRIVQSIPFYSHRFTVRPGLLGLDSIYLGLRGRRPVSEHLLLGYDLYYVKHGRMLLDLDILLFRILHPNLWTSGGQAVSERAN